MAVTLLGAKLNLLGLVQQACGELGLTAPNSVIGNPDSTATLFGYFANRVGRDLMQVPKNNGGWQVLRKEWTFNTAASGIITGVFTSGSPTITAVSNTANVAVGMQIVAYGYDAYPTTVVSTTSNTITMSANATASSTTAVSFYCGQDAYPLPTDMDWQTTQTYWDRAYRWQLLGPLSPQEWQVLKSGISPTGPRRRFRIMNNMFYLDPVPNQTGNTEVFEYTTSNWVQSLTGNSQAGFLLDTDYTILDDDCIIFGLKWRYKQRAGLDYTQEQQDYDECVERVLSRDGGTRNLPLNSSASGVRLLNTQNVPDTGFGS